MEVFFRRLSNPLVVVGLCISYLVLAFVFDRKRFRSAIVISLIVLAALAIGAILRLV